MTREEKIAVAVFELRQRGMHPAWIKWSAWFEGGHYLLDFFSSMDPIHKTWRLPPAQVHVAEMRRRGYRGIE